MKLLITGATGFIGSYLVERLYRQNELVCLIHDRREAKLYPNIDWIVQDLGSPLDETRIPSDIDAIIHLAQSRQYREFPERARDIFRVNVESTLSLLEYGRKIRIGKFIYASSGGIYGYSYEKFIETDVTNPINFYLTSKFCSELLVGNYNSYFSTVIFRFFFVYGPNQQGMLIPRLLNNIRKGEPIIIFGKSGIRINPIHVKDAINVFHPSLESPVTGVYNVAGDEVISIKELAETVAALVGKEPIFVYDRSNIPGDILGDNSRMKSVLGVVPQISLKKGIFEMIKLSLRDEIG
jgi:UDP-glucose 4-epimerase